MKRIVRVRPTGNYEVELAFTDGSVGTVDLAPWIIGRTGVFGALRDPQFFSRVAVDQEAGTIVWPNGADLCPDVLADAAQVVARPAQDRAAGAIPGARGGWASTRRCGQSLTDDEPARHPPPSHRDAAMHRAAVGRWHAVTPSVGSHHRTRSAYFRMPTDDNPAPAQGPAFRLDRTAFSLATVTDQDDDGRYWRTKAPQDRLAALAYLRQMVYGPAASARLQRVLEIAQLDEG